MKWNNRVYEDERGNLEVRETFYDDDKATDVIGWAEEPEIGGFDKLDDAIRYTKLILRDLERTRDGELSIITHKEQQAYLKAWENG